MAVITTRKAGFWIRVLASLIDGIILAVIGGILRQIFGTGAGGGLSTLVSIAYVLYFWTTTGQTPGHRALNLQVVREDGQKLDLIGAIIRYVGEIISAIALFIGFMWVGWDSQKQGWHDKMAHTYVVHVSPSVATAAQPTEGPAVG
ncbi:MAG: RDD family protein [Chloroflexota bacterium]